MKHLFDDWDALAPHIEERYALLFLDFDGTLAPIAPTPGEASLPAETRALLRDLAAGERCAIAVVSGRALEDLRAKVGLDGIAYIGNHGLEAASDGALPVYRPSTAIRELLDLMRSDLSWRLKNVSGVLFEDKGASLAVHYRLVDPARAGVVETAVRSSVAALDVGGLLEIAPGKKVLEVRQRIDWNKGTAVSWLLRAEELRRGGAVFPIYVGDDVTDEDGFRAVAGRGVGVLVGEPRETAATYYVRNPEEVVRLLRLVAATRGAPA